jgi:PAS domain S-box-containing protein
MSAATKPTRLKFDPTATAEELRAQQLRSHRVNLPWAAGGSAVTALFLAAMQSPVVAPTVLWSWLGGLGVVLGLRLATGYFQRRSGFGAATQPDWLLLYRIGFLLHGLVWGLASVMPLPAGDALHAAVLIVVLVGVAATSFTLTAFDLVAALLFGVPVLGLLGLRLLAEGDATYSALGMAVFVVLVFFGLTAQRAQRFVQHYVALRVAEAAQADALRRSEELLERTGATAAVGGWELELATGALRLTAQAYLIHDAPPSSHPTFDGFVSLYSPDQQVALRAGLAAVVAEGKPYDETHPIKTLRGRRRWVRLIGRPQLEGGKVVRINGVVQDITEAKAAELALAEKHHLLTLLVQTTHEGFWFIDAEGITTDVNPAMCEILGRRREEIIGRGLFEFVDASNAAIFREQVKQRVAGIASSYEIALSRPDGSLVDCFNNATPIFDTAGRRIGAIGMYSDISANKRADARLRATSAELTQKTRALQVTLDSMAQGIVSMDSDGRVSVHNRRLLELLELPETLVKPGATLTEIASFQKERGDFGDGLSYIAPESRQVVRTMRHLDLPLLYVRETRSGRRIEVQTRHLPDGGLVRTYADVTAYFEAQQALTGAKEEAERANRAKSEFLSRMSHELRTPMNAILGFGQLLVSDTRHPLPEQQRAHVGEILRGARHLLNLINEVLDLALVETGKLQVSLEPVQLAELLQECIGLVHPLARADGIDVKLVDEAGCACFVVADRTRLKQVLLNLVSNAIKYNRTQGHVHIACTAEARSVRIGISDNGPGLSAPQAARLFQAFERLDAVRTGVEGAGLGLALSKHLMDAMGGEIGLDSEVGIGSTFWLRLPRAEAPALQGRVELAAPPLLGDSLPPARLRKVLYIEDNPVNVLLMEAMLGRVAGLRMISAPLPMLGLQMALDERPDLILLDIQLPGMDGFEVLRRLRLNEAGRHVPVIAVSANAMAHDVEHGLAAGFVRYLTKPLDMQELLAAVEAALAAPQ